MKQEGTSGRFWQREARRGPSWTGPQAVDIRMQRPKHRAVSTEPQASTEQLMHWDKEAGLKVRESLLSDRVSTGCPWGTTRRQGGGSVAHSLALRACSPRKVNGGEAVCKYC